MKRTTFLLLVVCLFLVAKILNGEPITYYVYITDNQVTKYNEVIWWVPDTTLGTFRTNSSFGFRQLPFVGRFIQRQPFNNIPDDQRYRFIGNAPPYHFPRTFSNLHQRGGLDIGSEGFMTWIKLRGNNGIRVYQYPLGAAPRESLICAMAPPDNLIIFVNGQVEIEGTLVGRLTIGSSGDMWLVDDVKYMGSNAIGDFDEGGMLNMLGLASEENIIIKNNQFNGREDGYNADRNNLNRHSIVINGSLIALGESFTFEQQNDDWELYQGPTPDERGYVYLKGSVAQARRGYLHRSNHQSTGYGFRLRNDFRLEQRAPPGFEPVDNPDITGSYDRLELSLPIPYYVRYATVRTLVLSQGVRLVLVGENALMVRDSLIIRGSTNYPVTFYVTGGRSTIFVGPGGNSSGVIMNNAIFKEGVYLRSQVGSNSVTNCLFDSESYWEGRVTLDSCEFKSRVEIRIFDEFRLSRSIIKGGILVSGRTAKGNILNNTIIGALDAGVEINECQHVSVFNNIVYSNRRGIYKSGGDTLTVSYNNVFNNVYNDYYGCSPGEGSQSADPLFTDYRRSDYSLRWGSPCIDSGDPNSPRDPDGSRADMGALFHDHRLAIEDKAGERLVPSALGLTVSPNPFNVSTTVTFDLDKPGWVEIALFDIKGRLVLRESREFEAGVDRWTLDGARLGSGGVYLLSVESGGKSERIKPVYLK